jgi:hypothetical protein
LLIVWLRQQVSWVKVLGFLDKFPTTSWQIKYSLALDLRYGPSSTSNGLLARFAVPDSDGVTLNSVFAAKRADIAGVLGDLHLLHLLS